MSPDPPAPEHRRSAFRRAGTLARFLHDNSPLRHWRLIAGMAFPAALAPTVPARWYPRPLQVYQAFFLFFLGAALLDGVAFITYSQLKIAFEVAATPMRIFLSGFAAYLMCDQLRKRQTSGALGELWVTGIPPRELFMAPVVWAVRPLLWMTFLLVVMMARPSRVVFLVFRALQHSEPLWGTLAVVLFVGIVIGRLAPRLRWWAPTILAVGAIHAAIPRLEGRWGFFPSLIGRYWGLSAFTYFRRAPLENALLFFGVYALNALAALVVVVLAALAGYAVMARRGRVFEGVLVALVAGAFLALGRMLLKVLFAPLEVLGAVSRGAEAVPLAVCMASATLAALLCFYMGYRYVTDIIRRSGRLVAPLSAALAAAAVAVYALNLLIVLGMANRPAVINLSGYSLYTGIFPNLSDSLGTLIAGLFALVWILRNIERNARPEWE